jgi:diguanylate cyclase (GGDEF)-like protein/PAS domain S-box-containing protein
MNKPVKVLIVEDSEDDAKLALRVLERGGFDPTYRRVQTAAELETALAQEHWDAIFSDFRMPGFTGIDALRIFRSTGLDIPFILISGTIGEESAVNAMKAGASDYLMKTSLARLAPALERELKEAQMRAAHRRAQEALIDSENRFRQMAENIHDVFSLQEVNSHRILYISPAYEEIWGRSCEDLYANPESWTEAVHPEDRASMNEKYKKGMSTGSFEFEFRIVRPDGPIRWIDVSGFPVRDEAGKLVRVAGLAKDITERKTAQRTITRLNRVYAMLSGINTLIVRVSDRNQLFKEACRIAVEAGAFRMTWIGIVDRSVMKLVPVASAGIDEEFLTALKDRFSSSEGSLLENSIAARAIREKQPVVTNDLQNNPVAAFSKEYAESGIRSMAVLPLIVSDDAVGVLALYTGEIEFFQEEELKLLTELAGDISFAIDHIDKQERLNYLAYYDVLTGLANRSLFLERVAQCMRSAVSGGHKLAIGLIDLERFKSINDSLGQPAGDALLKQVAEWLARNTVDASLLARMDADHFAIVLPEVMSDGGLVRLVENLMASFLEHPFRLNDAVFRIGVKIGIALFPDDGADADTLFRNAEAALKKAKASGDRYLFYTQKMTEAVAGKLILENQLRQALDKGEFVLHYQPKVNFVSGKVTSAEALIRWNDPRTGLVPPGQFISVLEETGLIYEVGRWALRQAIQDYLRWRSAGLAAVRIAVNVSALQLRNINFIDEIKQVISLDAHASDGLELEITESVIMDDVEHKIASLQAIRAMGATIAIDDFGTGFSSLSYLARLPVDTLKIDRSFVIDMTAGPQGLALVSTIITLAHALNLKVVAEGVETEEQSRLLRLLNCDEMQGYLFSKPVPSEIFETRYLTPSPVV